MKDAAPNLAPKWRGPVCLIRWSTNDPESGPFDETSQAHPMLPKQRVASSTICFLTAAFRHQQSATAWLDTNTNALVT